MNTKQIQDILLDLFVHGAVTLETPVIFNGEDQFKALSAVATASDFMEAVDYSVAINHATNAMVVLGRDMRANQASVISNVWAESDGLHILANGTPAEGGMAAVFVPDSALSDAASDEMDGLQQQQLGGLIDLIVELQQPLNSVALALVKHIEMGLPMSTDTAAEVLEEISKVGLRLSSAMVDIERDDAIGTYASAREVRSSQEEQPALSNISIKMLADRFHQALVPHLKL